MNESSWSLKELREHVRRMPGDQGFILGAISSLDWSDRIFRYHFCEARDALRSLPIDKDDPASIQNHELLFMSSEQHQYDMLIVRANVLACIHTVRNAYDHLAQLCNALLITPSIPIGKCDFHRVRKKLPPSRLKLELDELSGSPWFTYIAAYSNTSKHRTLVQQSMHLSYVDGAAGLRAEAFTHDQPYGAYMVGDLLEGILEVKNHIPVCGRFLNAEVCKITPEGCSS